MKAEKKLLKDWQMWEDCILSFLRTHPGLREKFERHVDVWKKSTKLPPNAYGRKDSYKKKEFT